MKLTDYEQPSVTTDMVVFTIKDEELKVLLIKRKISPYKGKWALPGGFVRIDECLEDAAKRELKEETGVTERYLEQLYTFGELQRDPRGRVITISYMALVNYKDVNIVASSDASQAKWVGVKNLKGLAFDHDKILKYAIKRLRWKFEYTTIAFSLLSRKFVISEVQKIYEMVFSKKFDKRNFVKKLQSLDILKEEGKKEGVKYRPPMLYSLKKDIGDIVHIL